MAWNMPRFLEIHIIKKILLVQLYGCTRSIFSITITQHRVQNKCQTAFISAQWNSFWPIQMQMQAPMTEMMKDVMLPVA